MRHTASEPTSVKKTKHFSFHPLDYVLVVLGNVFMLALLMNISVLNNGLRVTPFILVTTTAAMIGDYGSGIFAIILGSIAVEYMSPPMGFTFTSDAIFKTFEFTTIGIIIFLLSWRSRRLHASNLALRDMSRVLQTITFDLKTEASGNKKQLKKLNDVNKDLVSLVNNFIEDDEYWARKLANKSLHEPKKRIVHAAKQTER